MVLDSVGRKTKGEWMAVHRAEDPEQNQTKPSGTLTKWHKEREKKAKRTWIEGP